MQPGPRLPFALVLLVVLGSLVAAPAAATTSTGGEGTLDGTLDSDTSTTDSSSTNVTDSDTSLSTSDSSSTDSTSSDGSTSDSTSSTSDGTSGGSTDDDSTVSLDEDTSSVDETTDNLTNGSLLGDGEVTLSESTLTVRHLERLESMAADQVETTTGEVAETTDSLDAEETIDGLTQLGTLSTSLLNGDGSAAGGPWPRVGVGAGGESAVLPATSNLQYPGDGADGGVPAPGPAGGVAIGIGAVAAAAVVRQWGSLPAALTGIGATLASVAPTSSSRWGPLDRLVRTIAPFRYSRYDDSDPLEHESRETVFELVQDAPGSYLSEVSDGAELPLSTARHHVRVLEQEDLVTGAKVRGKRRFYPAYTEGIELTAAMNDEATAAILDAIARLGASSVSDLAAELDRDPSTISHHLQRLADDDLIVRERDGRAVLNRLSADARTAIEPEREAIETPSESITAGGAD